MNSEPVLDLTSLQFSYDKAAPFISIDSLTIETGESVFLRGPSGSGKSTLLGLIGGVLKPQSGQVIISGTDMASLSPTARDRLRAKHLGIIFQQLNLLPYLDVVGNVALACRFSKSRRDKAVKTDGSIQNAALRLLKNLGLPNSHLVKPVRELSVGQQQRVAVARALIGSPDLVIADEPTSALDAANRDRFIELLNTQRSDTGCSLLFVSHDESLARHFDRKIDLSDLNKAVAA